jgi:hypothetical protein
MKCEQLFQAFHSHASMRLVVVLLVVLCYLSHIFLPYCHEAIGALGGNFLGWEVYVGLFCISPFIILPLGFLLACSLFLVDEMRIAFFLSASIGAIYVIPVMFMLLGWTPLWPSLTFYPTCVIPVAACAVLATFSGMCSLCSAGKGS